MTIIDKKEKKIRVKSRFCAICDSEFRWQCKCPNNKVMAKQVKRSFQSGKRHRGKRALEYCYETEKDENI
jgi:hypothetical protein|tara:strand:+ start:1510 stop:1719 length:210 start_codon:yes stop_codon:yes gene_type:complete